MNIVVFLLLSFLSTAVFSQEPVRYLLEYYSGNDFLSVTIQIPDNAREQTNTLIIPRSAPGTYAYTDYSAFVEQVNATSADGYRQVNFLRSEESGLRSQATALPHSSNVLTLRSR